MRVSVTYYLVKACHTIDFTVTNIHEFLISRLISRRAQTKKSKIGRKKREKRSASTLHLYCTLLLMVAVGIKKAPII